MCSMLVEAGNPLLALRAKKIKTLQVAVKRVMGVVMHWIGISRVQKCFELVSEIVIEM